jgi:hypothetical protein
MLKTIIQDEDRVFNTPADETAGSITALPHDYGRLLELAGKKVGLIPAAVRVCPDLAAVTDHQWRRTRTAPITSAEYDWLIPCTSERRRQVSDEWRFSCTTKREIPYADDRGRKPIPRDYSPIVEQSATSEQE